MKISMFGNMPFFKEEDVLILETSDGTKTVTIKTILDLLGLTIPKAKDFDSLVSRGAIKVNGTTLVKVNNYMLEGSDLTITIPSYITAIDNNCFEDCTNVSKIEIPVTVESIGDYAFSGCTNLSALEFYGNPGSGMTENLKSIGNYAFSGCNALARFDVPTSTEVLYANTFNGFNGNVICNSQSLFSTQAAPWGATKLYSSVMSGCYNPNDKIGRDSRLAASISELTSSSYFAIAGTPEGYKILNSVARTNSAGVNTWLNSKGIKRIVFNNEITDIDPYAFYETVIEEIDISKVPMTQIPESGFESSALKQINLPNTIKRINNYAFYGTKLTSLNLRTCPITAIYNGAFNFVTTLTNIDLPDSLRTLGDDVFSGCRNLEVYLPSGVTSVGDGAFLEVKKLHYAGSASGFPWGAVAWDDEEIYYG